MTIFVSIAAYRDPELIPTIADCLGKARWPDDLRFGICWQHGEGEPAPPALGQRMRLIDIPWQRSRGACWARAEAMGLYQGEDWFLQLDSHHRFAKGWDAILLDQAARTGSARPLLTAYAPAFDPALPLPQAEAPTRMHFDRFTPEGIALPRFGPIPGGWPDGAPVRARFLSAHLLFAPGRFVEDVPYDPDLYFIGEEITLAIRAFTHGYDLYHPGVHILWHEYTRKLRTKHWDDHVPDRGVELSWHDRDTSLAKVQRFLASREVGRFGCGTARSFTDYEIYAGIDFHRRIASPAARRGEEPAPADRPVARDWTVRLVLDRDRVPPEALAQPLFWYVGFHDDAGAEIARDDASRGEMQRKLAAGDGPIVIERHFSSPRPPASWTVWPTDRRGRWLDRIVGAVDADSLMIRPLEQEPIAS